MLGEGHIAAALASNVGVSCASNVGVSCLRLFIAMIRALGTRSQHMPGQRRNRDRRNSRALGQVGVHVCMYNQSLM